MKAATLFTGGGLADIGIEQAGFEMAWGIEIVPDIADVARRNLNHKIIAADILTVDPATLDRVDALHASPPCPNFSQAKAGRRETEADKALARQVARFVEVLRPKIFTLENVWAYRISESWGIIRDALYLAGYWLDIGHVNSADHGVPQTRKRMIVRALLGQMVPYLPLAGRWVGWYEAIEDLIPDLPETELANWQKAGLSDDLHDVLIAQGGYDGKVVQRSIEEPAFTVTANGNQVNGVKAILANSQNAGRYLSRREFEPAFTITNAGKGMPGALLFTDQYGRPNNHENRTAQRRPGTEPSFMVTASNKSDWRVVTETRTVAITPRALGRFQTLPNWYRLPEKKSLTCEIIGNGVPCKLAKAIYRGLQ